MYRAIAWQAIQRAVGLDDEPAVSALASATSVEVDDGTVKVDGVDVTRFIRTPEIDRAVTSVARMPRVREVLVARQRALGKVGGIVMEGRDIGTQVFPHADLKIFLDADPVIREQRRLDQQKVNGPSAESMAADLRERDRRDRTRATSPLVPAKDAVIIDSTHLSEDDVLHQVDELVKHKLGLNS
jgi:cytidylate kinase